VTSCPRCGDTLDPHDCPEDPETLKGRVAELEDRLEAAEALLLRCRRTNAIRMAYLYAELKAEIDAFLKGESQ
jgi:hypothetical protein